jgi:NAD(P)H-quinone oxidoreductase subunit 5
MSPANLLFAATALLPPLFMLAAMSPGRVAAVWRRFHVLSVVALVLTVGGLALQLAGAPGASGPMPPGLGVTLVGAWVAVLVQLLGTVIGVFSSRYLQGEPGQMRYVAALAGVLGAVHLLLLANHWLVLIAAWAAVGVALQHLLCFYADRPFARLAAHKKRVADRLADVLLLAAAFLCWREVGSGSLPALWLHLDSGSASLALQLAAVCLALAVVLRTALLPLHGWLIQVMEAPTPVSALLHAGVVNLGGFVLIRFAPLLEAAPVARWLLVVMGLATALLAGLVMLTRVSVKVRLAWSTVAQMGFMVMECALGLYTLALLHLIGHSLYKAHTFLAASEAVHQARLRMMRGEESPSLQSLLFAPLAAGVLISLLVAWAPLPAWPWWWSALLALAWAPLLWMPVAGSTDAAQRVKRWLTGMGLVGLLAAVALLGHVMPFGLQDAPHATGGLVALTGMAVLYACLSVMQVRPQALATWRRWSYAGFYVDEYATRAALRWWPARWMPAAHD